MHVNPRHHADSAFRRVDFDVFFGGCIRTENQNQASFSPFGPHEISVLIELTLGHLRVP